MSDLADRLDFGEELGRGATGIVRFARLRAAWEDLPAGTPVAVKILDPEAAADHGAREAFEREARAGAAVDHPALVHVLGRGELPEGPFLVLRYAPGVSLSERLEAGGPVEESELRRWGAGLAGALAALERAGWTHGDIKPENVRVEPAGGAVLLDLGFARALAGDAEAPRSGSLPYLAPERSSGGAATPAADVFALGVLLHEAATRRHPFAPLGSRDAEGWLGVMRRGGDVLPSRISPRLSALFDGLVRAMLAGDPRRRPRAEEVAEALEVGEASDWWRRHRKLPGTLEEERVGGLPFVGRAQELAALGAAFERARVGAGALVWIQAPPGAGKARLVDVFARRARRGEEPPLVLRERCTPQEGERSEQPVRVLLRQYLQLARHEPAGERARALLDPLVAAPIADALTQALDARAAAPAVAEGTALAEWLLALGRKGPTLVHLEDVDYAGELTLDVVSRVAEGLAGTRLLVVLSARGEEAEPGGRGARRREALAARATTRLVLPPFGEPEVERVVLTLFGANTPRRRLASVLTERSGGSPGLLADILAAMRAQGQLRRGPDGRVDLTVAPEDVPVPESVTRTILARLDELAPRDRIWLERFAVIGGPLQREFLAHAWPETVPGELHTALARLRASGWIVPFGSLDRFSRAPLREAVYDSIPEERRTRLHAEAADALGTALHDQPSQSLAFHRAQQLRAVGRHDEALAVIVPLLDDPRATATPGLARTLARWGLEAVDAQAEPDPRLRLRFLELGADAADRLGARSEQRHMLDRLSDLPFDPDADPEEVGRIYLLHGQYAMSVGQYGLSRGWLETAATRFARAANPELEAVARLRLAYVQGHVGKLAEAEKLARQASRLTDDELTRGRACAVLAGIALVRDDFEGALRLADHALQHLRALDEPTGALAELGETYLLQSRIYRVVGRPRRAFAALERARRYASRAGERRLEVDAGARLGRLLIDAGRASEAELELHEARVTAQEIEYRRGEALASLFLGTLLAEGDDPEASGILRRTTGLAHELGLGRVESLALALRARIALQHDDHAAADELSSGAFELFSRVGGELADRIVVEATRALVLERTDRPGEAAAISSALDRRVRRVNERIRAPILRQRQRRASVALLAACRTSEGPVYPRLALGRRT